MRKILFGKFSIIILAVFVVLTACSSKNEKQSETIGTQHKKIYSYEDNEYDYQDEVEQLEDEIEQLEGELEDLASENNELLEQIGEMGAEYEFFQEHACCVNENGSFYHRPFCDNFDDEYSYIYNTELAESYGYKPCPVCW